MLPTPQAKARPQIKIIFELGGLAGRDFGYLYRSFEFKAMVNGGYIVRAKLFDPHFNLLTALIEEGYFKEARRRPVPIRFQILAGPDGEYPKSATREQTGILLSLEADGDGSDRAHLEFIAIDPPSWFLNMGDGAGTVWKGRIDQILRQVVQKYAPKVNVQVGKTTDAVENRWWMMRQDPKSFISSILDWSSSIALLKTNWLVISDGYDLQIQEQGAITSEQRAYYRFREDKNHDTIHNWMMLTDNALSAVQTKIITQGISAISGQYFDRISDVKEKQVFAKDSNTENKQIPRVKAEDAFSKPPEDKPPTVGWTSISSIPEIYSAGEMGMNYGEYIDGRARNLWLGLTNALMRTRFEVLGHGTWSDCKGLGTDTVFIRWTKGKKTADSGDRFWWMTGNWLVYGFHHRVTRGYWMTDLYCSRFDQDAIGKKVG